MTEVPPSAIPESAWGISGSVPTPEEFAAQDPFEGHGLRLDAPRLLTMDEIHDATGMQQVITFGNTIIWVRLGPDDNGADVLARWQAWLAQEGVTDSP